MAAVPNNRSTGESALTDIDKIMQISDLKIFLAVASTGSFSAAARQLGVGPMQVSRRIGVLEGQMGVRLLQRTTRSLSLTIEGEALLPYANTIKEAEESALGEISRGAARVSGVLRISAPSVLAQCTVLSLLPQLLSEHPELRVDLRVSDRIVDIVTQGLDLALRIAPMADSGMIARRVAVNPRVICAAPGYLMKRGRPAVVADLDSHDCIILEAIPRWPLNMGNEQHYRPVSARLRTTSVEAVKSAAIQGLGLAMLTRLDVLEQLRDGSLIEIMLQDARMEELAVWAVMPSRHHVPARVRVFLEALQAALARQRI